MQHIAFDQKSCPIDIEFWPGRNSYGQNSFFYAQKNIKKISEYFLMFAKCIPQTISFLGHLCLTNLLSMSYSRRFIFIVFCGKLARSDSWLKGEAKIRISVCKISLKNLLISPCVCRHCNKLYSMIPLFSIVLYRQWSRLDHNLKSYSRNIIFQIQSFIDKYGWIIFQTTFS